MSDDGDGLRHRDAGRDRGRFQTTRWSVVRRAVVGGERTGDEESRAALGSLVELYWYPLYAFARRHGQDDHDAMDLTQGFFAHLLAGATSFSVFASAAGYWAMRGFWRLQTVRQWEQRKRVRERKT